jgi:hypothetical protein
MSHKIYISIIAVLLIALSYSSFTAWSYNNSVQSLESLVKPIYSSEKKIITPEGEKLACSVQVIDQKTGRMFASHKYILAKNNTCSSSPYQVSLSKEEYIKEIQTSDTWGILDDGYLTPIIAKPI